MSATKNATIFLIGRMSFPAIFQPSEFDGKERYELQLLMPEGGKDAKNCQAAIDSIAKSCKANLGKMGADRICLKDGEDFPYDSHKGMKVLTLSRPATRGAPKLLNKDLSPVTEADGVFYSGCVVKVKANIWYQDNKYGKRFNAGLIAIQFVRDDEPFGAGNDSVDDFHEVLDDPETGDDIPF